VIETKGLEFDVVIIPNLGAFEAGGWIAKNQIYVAISRARHSLMIGCADDQIDGTAIRQIQEKGLAAVRDVPPN
jgi:superfamily I DNA/RNA helicase